jgi:hypothetical protein
MQRESSFRKCSKANKFVDKGNIQKQLHIAMHSISQDEWSDSSVESYDLKVNVIKIKLTHRSTNPKCSF